MAALVGGLRDRFLLQSFRDFIYDGLAEEGWFDTGRQHRPVQVRVEPIPSDEEIAPNVVAIMEEGLDESEAEMGSILTEFRWEFAIDIYAESSAIGRHLWGDIKALLQGRFTSWGDGLQSFPVYDYRNATPPVIFRCQIEEVVGAKQKDYQKLFQKHWWTILCTVVDTYGNEDDD